MRNLLSKRADAIYVLVAGYCLLSVALKILRPDSLEIDESEQAFLSQYLMLGYGAQPPFYNWLQYGAATVFGISVASLTILKNALMCGFLVFYGLTARTLTDGRSLPAVAILGVLTLPPVFLLSQRDLSHTVAALFSVSLFLFCFFRVLKLPPRIGGYLLVGAAVGVGILSKYNFVIVPAAALLAILPEASLRKRVFDWRVLACAVAGAIVIGPHVYWVINNLEHATGVTVSEMKEGAETALLPHWIEGLVSLVIAAIKGVAPPVLVFAAAFYSDIGKILRAESIWTRVLGRMLLASFVLVALIVIVMGATHIRVKWLALFTALVPLYLTLKIDAARVDPAPRIPILLSVAGLTSVGVVLMLWARVFIGPMVGDYSFAHTPYNGFARVVSAETGEPPAAIVVDDRIVAGNLRIQFPDTPIILTGFSPDLKGESTMPKGRILAVWPVEGEKREQLPPRIEKLLAEQNLAVTSPEPTFVSIPYNAGRPGDVYEFGYVWAGSN